ncbi:penicillin-binding protein activator [Halovulum sp. GXIMD14793]
MAFSRLFRPLLALVVLTGLTACDMPQGGGNSTAVDPGKPVTVALLVPMGSTDAERNALGKSLVNAAKMAQTDLQGVTIDLKVYETAGELTTAGAAATKAVADGADIILGPLFADATTAVAPVAANAKLQVLSFSNNATVAGNNVWLLGPTFDNTASRVAGFAAGRGLTAMGIVHPQGIEGEQARDAIRNAANARGVRIVGEGAYPLSVQGISNTAGGIAKQMRGAGANVIVFTDGPTGGLPFITETLRGMGVRANATQFAGIQRWDVSPEALAQPGIQGGWYAAPDLVLTQRFNNRYEAAYGAKPHPLAPLAYDGLAAIGALVAEAQAEKRRDAFAPVRLTDPKGFAGVNGIFRFTNGGGNQRALAVFEVRDGEARVIDPAPRTFPGNGA